MTGNQDQDFAAATHALLDAHGDLMLSLVKRSIQHTLDTGGQMDVDLSTLPAELSGDGACFITLNLDGHLRGCIGSPQAHRALGLDLVYNANGSAFHDPRFGPVRREEAERLDIHISVLSPAHPFDFDDEADMLAKLNPGEDGLIIEDLGRRALFLPSVWAQLPEPASFVQHLKAKAGLSTDHWSDTFTAKRFIAAQCGANWADID
ncbi:AmmeMemoRadiSam system protein A [Pseudomonadota bacterium]